MPSVEEHYVELKEGLGESIFAKYVLPYFISENPQLTLRLFSYLGPFIYTNALLPLLKKTAAEPGSDVRIVNVCGSLYLSLVIVNMNLFRSGIV